MRYAWLGCLFLGSLLFAGTQDSDNVNTRYKVETVIVSGDGWTTNFASESNEKISSSLRRRISALIGERPEPFRAGRHRHAAAQGTGRHYRNAARHDSGDNPGLRQGGFRGGGKRSRFDLSVHKFFTTRKEGGSGALEGTAKVKHNSLAFGLVSDGDELVERYTGLTARYENTRLGSDRVHLRLEFDSFHEQWNRDMLERRVPGSPACRRLRERTGPARISSRP